MELLNNSSLPKSNLPYSENAEKSVLASILLNPERISEVSELLRPDDFYSKVNSIIYKFTTALYEKNEPIDAITVFSEISKGISKEGMAKSGFSPSFLEEYLEILSTSIVTDATLRQHAEIIKNYSIRRHGVKVCRDIINDFHDLAKTSDSIIEEFHKKALSVEADYKSKNLAHAKDIAVNVAKEIVGRSKGLLKANIGVNSGFSSLDNITGGFKPGDFIIIGARPGIGKTSLALNMATHISFKEHKKVGFFSSEMSSSSLMKRIYSKETSIHGFRIQQGVLSYSELKALDDVAKLISSSGLYIDDTPRISLLQLKTESRRLRSLYDIDIIFIDYISLITVSSMLGQPRYEQVSFVSKALKGIARELDIPLIALSQLTRDTEGREPTLATLRESGALEQDADMVILLHKENATTNIVDKNKEDIKLIISKHRNGAVGSFDISFIPHLTKFIDLKGD